MKEYKKEIIICILALAVTGWTIWFFNRSLQSEKEYKEIDLYSIVASHPVCILRINRIASFNRTMDAHPELRQNWQETVPDCFSSILTLSTEKQSSLITFHKEGVLLYSAISDKQRKEIEQKAICSSFSSYTPQVYEKDGIKYTFYPDDGNRFFGYFFSEGLLVAGHNRKLLEETATLYTTHKNRISVSLDSCRHSIDKNVPANVLLKSDFLDFSFSIGEDTLRLPSDYWIGCDLFEGEKKQIFTTFPATLIPEQFIDTLAFTFTNTIEQFILPSNLQYNLQEEENDYFYTAYDSTVSK